MINQGLNVQIFAVLSSSHFCFVVSFIMYQVSARTSLQKELPIHRIVLFEIFRDALWVILLASFAL